MMTDSRAGEDGARPPVSVVVPFGGDAAEARETIAALGRLRLRAGDEVIVADNTPDGAVPSLEPPMRVVRATAERSSYYARNAGAEDAATEWLLFIDADCRPLETLLDDFFALPIGDSVAALAGEITAADRGALLARWARSRRILDQRASLARGDRPAAATANLLVRRSAWEEVGGFLEGVRSGADYDFCWRLADAGLELESRPDAIVEHIHRETLRGLARQLARYAAGNAWQNRRRPGSSPPLRPIRAVARSVAGAVGFMLTGRFERGTMKAVDGVAVVCQAGGRLLGNAAAQPARVPAEGDADRQGALVVATDSFPVPSETFVVGELEALERLGWRVRVEAIARPQKPLRGAQRGLTVNFLEDEGILGRAAATAWALCRHPVRSAADLITRRRWSADERLPLSAIAPMARRLALNGEDHVHVHFAALAAAGALRAGRLSGVPVSVAPHGHEVFATPRALPAKLDGAAFVAAPCEYTARHLRGLTSRPESVHVVVMGVDDQRFRRSTPYPGGRTVVAVGRLVEKKGFVFLVEAAGLLEPKAPLARLVIAGDGPLRETLEQRAREAGIGGKVELPGQLSAEDVRALLEEADLFAMPCVVASNGDRDAMPVAAKEALAMEVPVAASDEVGLPELVEDGWGSLVTPGDSRALADGIERLLSLPPERRAEMGRAGRRFVLERCDVTREAEGLSALIEATARG